MSSIWCWHLFGVTDGPLLSRCCVAESDVWLVCRFCSFASSVRRNTFFPFYLLVGVHSEVEKIIHWMTKILLAAEITLRRLHRCVPQQELNLLNLPTTVMAQFRAGPPEVVRSDMLQARSLAAGSDHV